MRIFACHVQDDDIFIASEDYIREDYYPYWYRRMCNKYGKEYVGSFEDCLQDWLVVSYGWEVKEFEHLP